MVLLQNEDNKAFGQKGHFINNNE